MQEAAREIVVGYRLSPQQERLWDLQQGLGRAVLRVQHAIRVEGDLDLDRLRAVVTETAARHEILRSTFRVPAAMTRPVQVVGSEPLVALTVHEAAAGEPAAEELRIEEIFWTAAAEPFDLEKGPVVRLDLVTLGTRRHALVVAASPFHLDGAGLRNLIHEISESYGAERAGGEEPFQYADLASWQNELIETEEGDGVEFWRTRRVPPADGLALPFEGSGAFDPHRVVVPVGTERTARIEAVARAHGAEARDILLAAWHALLFRLSGNPDPVVGTAFEGRHYEGLAEVLGPFVRYLPIQVQPGDLDLPFAQLLRRVQQACAEIAGWQEYFTWKRLGWEDGSGRPLYFPFCFDFEEGWESWAVNGLTLRPGPRWALMDRFKVKLSCVRTAGLLSAEIVYDAGIYRGEEARRLAERFLTLLDAALAVPGRSIAELEVVGPNERAWLVDGLNDTAAEVPGRSLHEMFLEQTERSPGGTALVWEGGALTFSELADRVHRLAQRLRRLGVGPETRVGLCAERSPEMVTAILAILEAGGAYIPLEPSYPRDRLAFVLADADPTVLLGERRLLAELAPTGLETLAFDDDLSTEPAQPPAGGAGPDNLAYILYTSGSTGRPKGVMISHRAIANRLLWMQRRLPIGPSDVVVLKTPFGFDASIWELFVPLFTGARLVLARPDGHRDAAYLAELIARHGVTIFQLVPSMLRVFLEEPAATQCPSLRRVFCGGEALAAELTARFTVRLSGAEIHNLYGPTECSIDVSHWPVPLAGGLEAGAVVPIGRPIDNLRIYLLDGHLQTVPAGVPGELFASGIGLARGYWNRPDLSAERFLPDPLSPEPGARMYRTGDLARLLPDGAVSFLGRIDHQVKVRGFRVELGEIEAVLGAHPGVLESTVLAREDVPGDVRLVAYWVPRPGESLDPAGLRAFLAGRLPEPMVPTAFVELKAMPVLPNGKLDRRALPPPAQEARSEGSFVAPRNEIEEMVAALWSESLHLERVGADDDFFALGGHSLLATQVVARVKEAFRIDVALRDLFAAPTLAAFSQRVELALAAVSGIEIPAIEPVPREGDLPLSFAQQRLLFLESLSPGTALYHLPMGARVHGRLDVGVLARSLSEIVRRHESLRTTFTQTDRGAFQVIAEPQPVPLPVADLSALGKEERREEVRRLATAEARRGFDLQRGPLLRVTLLRLADREHVVLITMHHIISDGWSTGVLVRELAALLRAYGKGEPSPLAELRIQYADFAVSQRQWLQGEAMERQIDFWRRQLAEAPVLIELPTDRSTGADRSWRGSSVPLALSRQTSARLQELGRESGCTLFMVLLAAFDALLHRWTGQDRIVVGVPVAARSRGDLEPLIGFFVNTLALPADLEGNPAFLDLVRRTRETALEGYAHQDLPFEIVVEALKPERGLSRAPLFQVLFALQNAPLEALELPGLQLGFLVADAGTAKFDWTLSLTENETGLSGTFEYATDLFDRTTILRAARHFTTIVEGLLADPGQRLSELSLLSNEEEHQICREWNDTRSEGPGLLLVPRIFAAQAERTPAAPAVVFEDGTLSYGELNRRANGLALRLRSLGVSAGTLVGLYAERSVDLAVGLLAILKAGGAFVPLDPAYPMQRLSWILDDAAVPVLLAQPGLPAVPAPGTEVVPLAASDPGPAAAENAGWALAPEDHAYLLHTSGTTGRPKAVAVPHGSLSTILTGVVQKLGFQPGERMISLAPFSFDIFLFELLAPLISGGTAVLIRLQPAVDLSRLLRELETASWMQAVPAVLRQVVEAVRTQGTHAARLRGVVTGGEAVPEDLLAALRQTFPQTQVWDLYGPTECTILSSGHAVSSTGPLEPLIGRPLPDVELLVCDRSGQPVPIGVHGEIRIGGAGVAWGYLHRPALTADQFAAGPGGRYYRTGDLARQRPDGNLEFLGRLDRQVKIRGVRLEPGEIEAVLRQHVAVRDAAVVPRPAPGGDRLIAYVVLQRDQYEVLGGLATWLRDKLPKPMVPGAFVALESLPLTPNSKLDVAALPEPDWALLAGGSALPRGAVEELVAGLWAEVLGLDRVGVHDSFWDIGGHSLLATQVIARIRHLFGVELPLRSLFEDSTVEALARRIDAALGAAGDLGAPPIAPTPRDGDLPLSFAQQRLLFLEELAPGTPLYNILVALRIEGPLEREILQRTFDELVRRHESLRTTFATSGHGAVQVIHPSRSADLRTIDLRGLSPDDRRAEALRLARQEAGRAFDLVRGPLLRVTLLHLSEVDQMLLLAMHHIVSDGWSVELLLREAATLVDAFSRGEDSPLSEPRLQYADFAAWQRRWLQGAVLERQLRYWREQLGSAPEPLALPTDRSRPALRGWRGAQVPVRWPASLAHRIQTLGRHGGATTFMMLLAAFESALHRYTGQERIVVGTPVANRNRAELESLVGFFANTLALAIDLGGDPPFEELVVRVREVALDAYAHQDLPFEMLMDYLQPERDLSRTPIFQVALAFQNLPSRPLTLPHRQVSFVELGGQVSKFDWTLALTETSEGLTGSLEYATDLYDRATVLRFLGNLETLLAGALESPQQRLSELPLLTAAERHQLLGQRRMASPVPAPLHRLFEAAAERDPQAVAVVDGDRSLRYGELEERANRLAHHLRRLGVGREIRVALFFERSAEIVVGLLAVLKAGGAYVPLDPTYPRERLAFVLADTAAPVILTQEALVGHLPASPGACIVRLDADAEALDRESPERPAVEGAVDQAAYVIYTSGSTGNPKGVVIPHANVVRLFTATEAWFNFGPQDVWTLFHSYAFDFSVWEIWGALLYGGRLVVVPYFVSRSPGAFHELLHGEGVTVLNQTPSAFRQLIRVEEEGERPPLSLRCVIFGGEALEPYHLRPWVDRHGDRTPELVNMYGITETTVHVTYRPIRRADLGGPGSPIGGPIPDLELHVLDRWLRLLAFGVPGELFVGGAGLARGYLNRPELTADRFLPDPLSGQAGARLYRTGDLVRRLASGEIEYLGRIDSQIKLRGFRIELGEIEAALAANPAVRETVVLLRREVAGEARLVAYVVPRPGATPTAGGLRSFLLDKLPEHALPAAFVLLGELPLTPNGKLDRRALPAPDIARPELDEGYAAPGSPVERALAEIWEEILDLERVGVRDNFFALGGDSIRSIRLIALARERGIELSLPQLFQHPTIAALGEEIGEAGGKESVEAGGTQPFHGLDAADLARLPAGLEDAYPLTRLQAGMLYHMQLLPEAPVYHNVNSFLLRSPFALGKLQEAVDRVVARHPVLRTSFDLASFSEPLQLVHATAALPLTWEDLRQLDQGEQEQQVDAYLARETVRHFAFSVAPQLRLHVHLRRDDLFQLTLTENHAILDGWSLHSTLNEVFSLYNALLQGEDPAPEPLLRPFREFVWMEREVLASEEARSYWERQLADAALSDLPRWPLLLHHRSGPRVAALSPTIRAELSDGLKRLAATLGVPIKCVLLTAHLKVLSLWTGTTDLVTGMASHSRLEGIDGESTRGLFLNMLPLRIELADGSWSDLVRHVFAAEQEMLPFRRFPMAELQKRHGQRPLFETAFNFVHFHVVEGILRSGDVEVLGFKKSEETNIPLSVGFSLNPLTQRLGMEVAYDTTTIPDAQATAILGTYLRILAAMVAAPQARHDAASLLSAPERHLLLTESNDTASGLTHDRSIPELFATQVAADPDAVAVLAEDRRLTRRELDAASNRLARHLRALGVGLGDLVGVCVDRSPDLVAALLAILKAGAGYVPLEPDFPRERLALMARDTGLRVVVTERRLAASLPTGLRILELDGERQAIARQSAAPLAELPPAQAVAYVMYTSGSTGWPKGVAVSHRAVSRLVRPDSFAALGPEQTLLQLAPVAFDASTFEIWGSLLRGGRLAVFPPHQPSVEELGRFLRRHGVSTLWLTAGLFHVMTDQGLEHLRGLPQLLAGGDVLSVPHVQRFLEGSLGSRLINGYGPTECTTFSCCHTVTDPRALGASVPIGRPIADTEVYIIGPGMQPAPLGAPGELWIGGAGLAQGYWRQPALTAEKFVPHPFAGRRGERLYRSGDRARWLPGRRIEFLGRIDQQVKIRGFRVEPGEIESLLAEHPGVERAAVVVRRADDDQPSLAAYLVWRHGAAGIDDLKAFLRSRLPEHMVPAFFVDLPELPLNANGKVDRRALPEPRLSAAAATAAAAPQTPTQEILAGLWCAILGVPHAAADDDFFALGGHSLSAMQLISRVRHAFGVELELATLFEAPTLAALAEEIDEAVGQPQQPPIEPQLRAGLLPLSFAQERLWFLAQLDAASAAYNIPNALRLRGPLDVPLLARTLSEIVRRHEVLRTTFGEVDGQPVQVVHPPSPCPLPVIDLRALPGSLRQAEVDRRVAIEAARPFDLAAGPLLRTSLVRLGDEEHVALLTLHHIVSDGWSMRILVDEVAGLYRAFLAGGPSPLPELPVQYADYALWQRRVLDPPALEQERAFWRERLAGVRPGIDLPTDRPRPPRPTYSGDSLPLEVPGDLAVRLATFSRAEGVTQFMTILAAFQTLLRFHAPCDEMVLGTDVANRDHTSTEGMIGFFINQLVLRTDLSGDPTFRELLARVRRVVLEAYAHRNLPFEKVVEAVNPDRTADHAPLFQVRVAFNNVPLSRLELPGLSLSSMEPGISTVQLDLVFSLGASDRSLGGILEFRTELFDRRTIERMLDQYGVILQTVVERPDLRLSDIERTLVERQRAEQADRDSAADQAALRRLKSIRRQAPVR
jgi:amino acid adenylation domain-containing protein